MVESTILSRKMIKPSSSTPCSLRRHNLSLFDHISTPAYAPIAAFYSKPANNNISQILENSLSTVLTSYYPFAGRFIEENKLLYVDCNDTGVDYLNVRINCPMKEVLNHPYNDAIDVVFPKNLPWSSSLRGSNLLVAQLSHFDCGGLAISVCISHKIVDGYSLCKFLNDWASTARDLNFKPPTQFDAASFFPISIDDPPYVPDFVREPQRCLSKMYNFSSSSLDRLKDSVSQVQNPTRVEVATALLHTCLSKKENFKPTLLSHVMNLRNQSPLMNTIGNMCGFFSYAAETEDEVQVHRFVAKLREAKQHLREKMKDQIAEHALESMKAAANTSYERMFCSSLCNLGLCNSDFGWGKPIRVTLPTHPMKNSVIFLDEPNGEGINAIITLTEADMLGFQRNQELLEFTSPVVTN